MKVFLLCVLAAFGAISPAFAEDGVRTILLVRHGEYDADPKADPKLGPHLSPLGVAQGHLLGARLAALPGDIEGLHTSPLQRARDTAAAIGAAFPGRNFETVEELAECIPPARRAEDQHGEPPAALAACEAQLDRLFRGWFKPPVGGNRTELFVSHHAVIRYLVAKSLGVDPKAWAQISIGHASITRIRIRADGSMQVGSVGDVGHLPPNLQSGSSADPERSLDVPGAK